MKTVVAAAGAAAFLLQGGPAALPRYDLIVRHGTILDGTGAPPRAGDVGVIRDRIAAVGDLSGDRGAIEIDAASLDVAPGFINLHSHAAPSALPTAENMLTQGVTTEVLNPDGGGPIDVAEQMGSLEAGGLAVNVAPYIGFNSVWASVVGAQDRRATAEEIARMRSIVGDNLAHGAWGLSAGLDYKPAYFATTDEVVQVARVAAQWRTNFPNHDRLTPEMGYSSRAGISETIAIGERAGLVPVVTHMKVQGHEQGSAADVLGLMSAAAARGHFVGADVYPYLAGQTALGALTIPAWAQDGGRAAMLERFKDPQLRARIVKEVEEALDARFNGAEGVFLPASGRQLVDVMREMHAGAGETIVRIVEQENTGAILRFGSEADLVKILQYPATSIACDCGASRETRTHPRTYGTFPRVLGRYVRETHALTWQDAVRKMTGLPAATIGMVDRGVLAPGMAADLTVFDPAVITDHATYEDPARQSEGVRLVVVNGRVALRDGRPTGERGGRALARSAHMPSRQMGGGGRVAFTGQVGGARVVLDVRQKPGAREAEGTLRISDPHEMLQAKAVRLGVLQTADGWASVTGRVVLRPLGEDRAVTVIVDRQNPLADDHGAAVIVDIERMATLRGTVSPNSVKISAK